ncbi:protein translocase subunit SecD [Georgenia sp. TF02-10]|uniref:protein translocase subunit SecD n=1 Tax=Georgenia sp. TF02-10 TaxID=2917725 RepID=UPI001FA7ED78|nr:protein translocase subunit SecD [Georgenia sp. TF02-10]UNX53276.1 protein translocase subunit SecD [Georgenia sp. TF02-10]
MAQRPKKPRPGRTLGLLAVLVIALLGTLVAGVRLTADDENPASFAPKLALDLEGGTQLILTPTTTDGSEVTQEDVDQAIEIIRQRVDASGVAEAEITSQGGQNIVVSLPGRPSEETLDLVRQSAQLRFRPVLTTAPPGPIDPAAAAEGEGEAAEDPADAAAEAPEAVTEGEAPAEGETATDAPAEGETATEAPAEGETATEAPAEGESATPTEEPTTPPTREEIEAAARQAADSNGDGQLSTEPAAEPADSSDLNWVTEQLLYDFYMLDCTDQANLSGGVQDDPAAPLVSCSSDGTAKFVLGPTALEGTHVTSASSGIGTNAQGMSTGQWVVSLEMDGEGTDTFAELSQRLLDMQPPQNQFAIVLDGLVISAPEMQAAILDGRAQISGSFDRESAATLANQLNFGSLPLDFAVQSQDEISATLGSEQLSRGILAGLLGAVLVVLYMLWQYRGLGLVSVASLLIAAALTYLTITLLSWLVGYRLSLPGVVGMIVAVGITADSFIVYFERIRDEVREGRLLVDAVEHGWSRARRTIIASDTVNFLAAVVLYFLAVGGVRGFAFTLGLTTLIDLLVVAMFTHPLMRLLIRTKFFGQGHRLSGLDPARLGASSATYRGRGRFGPPRRPATAAEEPQPEPDRALVGVGASAGPADGAAAAGRSARGSAMTGRSAGGSAGTSTPSGGATAAGAASASRAAAPGTAAGPAAASEPGGDGVPGTGSAPESARSGTSRAGGSGRGDARPAAATPTGPRYAEDGRRLTIAERRAAERARLAAAAPPEHAPQEADDGPPGTGDEPAGHRRRAARRPRRRRPPARRHPDDPRRRPHGRR